MRIESVESAPPAAPSARLGSSTPVAGTASGSVLRPEDAERALPTTVPGFLALAVRHKYVLLATTSAMILALVAPALLRPRTYTAHASFILAGARSDRGGLGAVAAELGLPISTSDPARSPSFYADLLTTRALLQEVVRTSFPIDGRQTTLIEHYALGDKPAHEAVRKASDILRRNITVRMESQTGMVMLSVSAVSPTLAERIAARLLEELNKFNLQVRKSQAANERRFVSERYEAAQRELMAAETELQSFLARNRAGLANSPQLAFQHDRLERNVALRQRIFASLAESFEHARIEEVRDTPVITVIDAPSGSSVVDRRGTGTRLLLGTILGLLAGLFVAVVRDFVSALRQSSSLARSARAPAPR